MHSYVEIVLQWRNMALRDNNNLGSSPPLPYPS